MVRSVLSVEYRPDSTPSGSATPVPKEPVTPVAASQLAGTVDNLTAYLLLERQLARGGSCALKVPVFDGRHRYDLEFSDLDRPVSLPVAVRRPEVLRPDASLPHGARPGNRRPSTIDPEARRGRSVPGTIWYAARLLPDGDLAVPVRLKMETEIGDVAIYLSQLKGRGVDPFRLME